MVDATRHSPAFAVTAIGEERVAHAELPHTCLRARARDLAVALLASYEGIALLANTFREPELMIREGRRLERWIDSLARDSKGAR